MGKRDEAATGRDPSWGRAVLCGCLKKLTQAPVDIIGNQIYVRLELALFLNA